MYKLVYFEAHNLEGFYIGMNKKKVIIDLRDYADETTFVILGGNGRGKSVFGSFISFLRYPIAKFSKFVIPDKEGLLIREFQNADGKIVRSKCVYIPSGDASHTCKAYLSIKEPGEDKFTEMNPGGLATVYDLIASTVFDVDLQIVEMTRYYDKNKGIIDLSSRERNKKFSKMIKIGSRFLSFNKQVEKMGTYNRAILKNISAKMTTFRTTKELQPIISQLEKDIDDYIAARDDTAMQIATYRERISSIYGDDPDAKISDIRKKQSRLSDIEDVLKETTSFLKSFDKNHMFTNLEDCVIELAIKKSELEACKTKAKTMKEEIYKMEEEVFEIDSCIHSENTQNIDSLKSQLKSHISERDSLSYAEIKDKCDGFEYSEVVVLNSMLEMLDDAITSLIETYGNNIPNKDLKGWNIQKNIEYYDSVLVSLESDIVKESNKLDKYKSKSYLKDRLNMRPTNCEIDTCPFISEALDWGEYERLIDASERILNDLNSKKNIVIEQIDTSTISLKALKELYRIEASVHSASNYLMKYLGVKPEEIVDAIYDLEHHQCLTMNDMRSLMVVLSEKARYEELDKVIIPNINNQIFLLDMKNNEIDRLLNSRDRLQCLIDSSISELSLLKDRISELTEDVARLELDRTEIQSYKSIKKTYDELKIERKALSDELAACEEMVVKGEKYLVKLDKLTTYHEDLVSLIEPKMRELNTCKLEFQQVSMYEIDKAQSMRDLSILNVLSKMSKPGKGVWRKVLKMFSAQVVITTNMLLEETFDGDLAILPFTIDPDSEDLEIPFTFRGSIVSDISKASSGQGSTLSTALTLALIDGVLGNWKILSYDEVDKDLSQKIRKKHLNVLLEYTKVMGIEQLFITTHSPDNYSNRDVCYIAFPEAELPEGADKVIWV